MKKLNGYKSYFGFAGMFILGGLGAVFPEFAGEVYYKVAFDFCLMLAGIGVAHKLTKLQ